MAPINYDYVCVAVPKAGHIPKYWIPFTCFPYDVWLAILATFFAVYATNKLLLFVWSLDRRSNNAKRSPQPLPPPLPSHSFLLTTLSATLNIPIPQSVNKYVKCRIVLVTYLCFMYVIVSIFQACLVTQLSAPKYYKDIDTLQELDASRLTVKTWSPLLKDIMNVPISKQYTFTNKVKFVDFERLFQSSIHQSGNSSKLSTDDKLKFAFVERIPLGKRKEYENFIIKAGDRTYEAHTVSECPFGFYVSYIVNPRFPFVSEFNLLLHRISEAALINRWTESVKYAISAEYYEPMKATTKFVSEKKIFTLQDLEIAIIMLIGGYSISCTTFVAEMTYHRFRKRRIERGARVF